MARKTVEVPDKLWREFEVYAVRKFGHYGAIKKAVEEAIKLWLKKVKEELQLLES